MRPSEVKHLQDLVEKKKSFKLIPYHNGHILSFEARRNYWIVSSPEFLSYPEELEVEVDDKATLGCYFECGYILAYEFNLENFFQVLGWIPEKKEEKE